MPVANVPKSEPWREVLLLGSGMVIFVPLLLILAGALSRLAGIP